MHTDTTIKTINGTDIAICLEIKESGISGRFTIDSHELPIEAASVLVDSNKLLEHSPLKIEDSNFVIATHAKRLGHGEAISRLAEIAPNLLATLVILTDEFRELATSSLEGSGFEKFIIASGYDDTFRVVIKDTRLEAFAAAITELHAGRDFYLLGIMHKADSKALLNKLEDMVNESTSPSELFFAVSEFDCYMGGLLPGVDLDIPSEAAFSYQN